MEIISGKIPCMAVTQLVTNHEMAVGVDIDESSATIVVYYIV